MKLTISHVYQTVKFRTEEKNQIYNWERTFKFLIKTFNNNPDKKYYFRSTSLRKKRDFGSATNQL